MSGRGRHIERKNRLSSVVPGLIGSLRPGKHAQRRQRGAGGWLAPKTAIMACLAVIAFLGLGGIAWAYFTSQGSGTASASTGSLQGITIQAATGTVSTPLIPGGTGDVILQIKNTNSYAVTLISVVGNGTITADAGHSGCTTTGVTFTGQTSLTTNIPANATTPVDLSGAASMSNSSSNGCQGATFSIPVTITVKK